MKKIIKIQLLLCLLLGNILLFGCKSTPEKNDTSQLTYTYARLRVMDLDQMSEIMQDKVREFKKTNSARALQDGLLICLSRPDEDSIVEKVISTVKNPLEDNNLWEQAIEELVDQSISVMKDSSQSSTDQVTYSIVLENLIAEMRPEFLKQYKSPDFESRIIQKIASADVELSEKAKTERKLNLMKASFSASQVAQKLIDKRDEHLKKDE